MTTEFLMQEVGETEEGEAKEEEETGGSEE